MVQSLNMCLQCLFWTRLNIGHRMRCCVTCATYHYVYYVHANICTVYEDSRRIWKLWGKRRRWQWTQRGKHLSWSKVNLSVGLFFLTMGIFIHWRGLGWDPWLKNTIILVEPCHPGWELDSRYTHEPEWIFRRANAMDLPHIWILIDLNCN